MKDRTETLISACPEATVLACDFLCLMHNGMHAAADIVSAYKKLLNTFFGISDTVVRQYNAWPYPPYRF